MSPPLRAEEDRVALVEALSQGLLDVMMSDHNPQDVETKRLPSPKPLPAPSAWKPCWRLGCGWSTTAR